MEVLSPSSLKIAAVVASYWIISISLVFLNKFLLSSPDLNLKAPLFVTWVQCLIAVAICALMASWSPRRMKVPTFQIQYSTAKQVLPLSFIFVGMITFNNLCLQNVGVAFYYIGRSLTTVFNVVLSYLILQQTTSWRALLCCAAIVAGFVLGVDQEHLSGSLSISGVVYGILASVFVALNSIYTKKVMGAVGNDMWQLTLYNNFNASVLFIPLVLFSDEISSLVNFSQYASLPFWSALILGGVFGTAISYVAGLQIQVTSPLTHNVSGTAKACAQTALACVVFEQAKTLLWWSGNAVVLGASLAYTTVRHQEMQVQRAKQMFSLKDRIEKIEMEPLRAVKS